MVVSVALDTLLVLRALYRLCTVVYRVATDHSADLQRVAHLGLAVSSGRQLFMLNKKHAMELLEIAAMIEADLRGFKEREKNNQLSPAVRAHLKDVAASLQAAESVVQSVIMPADVAKSMMGKVKWIAGCVYRRSSLQQSLVDATAALVRSCQLLSIAVQLRADGMRHDADDGRAADAAEIRQLMEVERLDMSADLQAKMDAILLALQQRSDEQADRFLASVEREFGHQRAEQRMLRDEFRTEMTRMRREIKRAGVNATAASTAAVASSRLPLPCVSEGAELVLHPTDVLGEGRGGLVRRAYFTLSGSAGDAALKEVKSLLSPSAKDKQRMEKQLKKEATIMWAINGHPNCVRLHALCTKPLGLVLELCNAGSLDRWLWVWLQGTVRGQKVLRVVPNHLLPRGPSSQTARTSFASGAYHHADDGEDDNHTFESLLAEDKICGCLTPVQRITACTDVINAVDYLHGRHMSHGDIKADNVLVQRLSDSVLSCKLGDFGSAKVEKSWTGAAGSTMQAKNVTGGTERWQSQEALRAGCSVVVEEEEKTASAGSFSISTSSSASSSSASPAAVLADDDRRNDVFPRPPHRLHPRLPPAPRRSQRLAACGRHPCWHAAVEGAAATPCQSGAAACGAALHGG